MAFPGAEKVVAVLRLDKTRKRGTFSPRSYKWSPDVRRAKKVTKSRPA
jgi:hypothetical protein